MLQSGQELSARFVLVRALGAGGGGAVWLAQDRERGSHVAVKILADDLMQNVAAVAALQRECERAHGLEHPNILRMDRLYRSAHHVWIAMEYASGGDLSQLRGRSCGEVLRAVVPVAGALAYAHRAGVVHRDVKPSNVLLMSDGSPRLADFGIALAIAAVPAADAGRGSPWTMSPQQLDGAAASPADDIYAFGALIYELLTGYPPLHPDITPQRIRSEVPASLSARADIPAAVAQLIDRCLAKSPADRPTDMSVVERELQTALENLPAPAMQPLAPPQVAPPGMRPPAGQGDALRSEWQRSNAAGPHADELRRQGFRRGLLAAALIAGVAGIFIVLFALPKWVATGQPAPVARNAAIEPETPPAEQKKELDFAALARAKQQAEEQRAALDERWQKLLPRAVDQWGGAEYRQVIDAFATGGRQFGEREYAAAVQSFGLIAPLLDTLEQRAGEVLKAQLMAGAKALSEGRSADAKTAFELAAKLDPPNQSAARGLKRAATLDEVFALLASAERLEKEGRLTTAAETFRKALVLDSEAPRANEALARIGARVAGDAYAGAMARGFSALARSDHMGARREFESAGRIRPGSPEVAQALKQIEQEERTRVITARLGTARDHEAKERWADALREYRAILELDATIAAANEAVARVTPRAALNEELDLYVTQPERLFSQPVRVRARDTLGRARAIANPGPVLEKQIATLSDWLARADVPVQVALQSDNLTQVTIYRVGVLGAFEQRALELAPGSYTVVGTRPGYRDVRRQIDVIPGAPLPPIVIRCEDRI